MSLETKRHQFYGTSERKFYKEGLWQALKHFLEQASQNRMLYNKCPILK